MSDTTQMTGDNSAFARSARAQRAASENNRTETRTDGVSVIGRDLVIVGDGLRIVSQGKIQVDGQIEGDVIGNEVVIGTDGLVKGLVNASRVIVHGTVNGAIRGEHVELTAQARVDADIHHAALTLEQGASFEGKSRRPQDVATLRPDLSTAATAAAQRAEAADQTRPAAPPIPSNSL